MYFKDILAPLFGDDTDERLIDFLDRTTAFDGAHVAAALVFPVPVVPGELVTGGIIARCHEESRAAKDRLQRAFARTDITVEHRFLFGPMAAVCEDLAVQARHADLTVMTRPTHEVVRPDHEIMEAALMQSGRPVLLAPATWVPRGDIETVLIGWNASREGARAIADAMPFLTGAKRIVVATVDARPTPWAHGEAPGVDIATHLARRKLPVELQNLDSVGAGAGEALVAAARSLGADLIVTGGFGHARLRQALFGGVTRTLVEHAPAPLLLSH
jgi:nucleotide-binding universal stress UspA family protein